MPFETWKGEEGGSARLQNGTSTAEEREDAEKDGAPALDQLEEAKGQHLRPPPPALEREQAARALLDEEDDQHEDHDLAEHRAGPGLEDLVGDAEAKAPSSVPQRLPTPPNTTTMKLSMM